MRLLTGDKHWGETFANVITSLPFIVLGLQAPRQVTQILFPPPLLPPPQPNPKKKKINNNKSLPKVWFISITGRAGAVNYMPIL